MSKRSQLQSLIKKDPTELKIKELIIERESFGIHNKIFENFRKSLKKNGDPNKIDNEITNLKNLFKSPRAVFKSFADLEKFNDDINKISERIQKLVPSDKEVRDCIFSDIVIRLDFTLRITLENMKSEEFIWKHQNPGLRLGLFLASLESILSSKYQKVIHIVSNRSEKKNHLLAINYEGDEAKSLGEIVFEKVIFGTIDPSILLNSKYSSVEFETTLKLAKELDHSIRQGGPRSLKRSQIQKYLRQIRQSNSLTHFKYKLMDSLSNGYIPTKLGAELLKWFSGDNERILENRFHLLLNILNLIAEK